MSVVTGKTSTVESLNNLTSNPYIYLLCFMEKNLLFLINAYFPLKLVCNMFLTENNGNFILPILFLNNHLTSLGFLGSHSYKNTQQNVPK